METKRNEKYFTAPAVSVVALIGYIVIALGVIYAIAFRRHAMPGILAAIVGFAIAIFGSGGKSTDSDIDFQIAERVKNLQEQNEKKHEVYEKSFLRQRQPIDLKGYDFETDQTPFYFKKGSDGIGRTNYFMAVNLIFTNEKIFLQGRRFSVTDESIDEEISGQWFYNELTEAVKEDKVYEYKKGDRTMQAKYTVFQIMKADGQPALKMCVDTGADIDTYTDQISRVIVTRQRELEKRAQETAQRRAEFRAKIAAEQAAEEAAAAAEANQ